LGEQELCKAAHRQHQQKQKKKKKQQQKRIPESIRTHTHNNIHTFTPPRAIPNFFPTIKEGFHNTGLFCTQQQHSQVLHTRYPSTKEEEEEEDNSISFLPF
jgi:hypothetical protein